MRALAVVAALVAGCSGVHVADDAGDHAMDASADAGSDGGPAAVERDAADDAAIDGGQDGGSDSSTTDGALLVDAADAGTAPGSCTWSDTLSGMAAGDDLAALRLVNVRPTYCVAFPSIQLVLTYRDGSGRRLPELIVSIDGLDADGPAGTSAAVTGTYRRADTSYVNVTGQLAVERIAYSDSPSGPLLSLGGTIALDGAARANGHVELDGCMIIPCL